MDFFVGTVEDGGDKSRPVQFSIFIPSEKKRNQGRNWDGVIGRGIGNG